MKKYVNNSFINKSPLEYKNGTDAVTTLPVQLYTDGQPVSSYTLKGNTSVSGTPSPQNPITISGVGNETANLYNKESTNVGYYSDTSLVTATLWKTSTGGMVIRIPCETETEYTITAEGYEGTVWRISLSSTNNVPPPNVTVTDVVRSKPEGTVTSTFTTLSDTLYILLQVTSSYLDYIKDNLMFNKGSYMPYEPYDKYKISILKGLTPLTPIYVSQPLMYLENGDNKDELSSSGNVTYKIAKYICKGNNEESWSLYDTSNVHQFYSTGLNLSGVSTGNNNPVASCLSNIAPYGAIASTRANYDFGVYLVSDGTNLAFQMRGASNQFLDVTTWKQYLADQYAAGTPIIVYYVLATPTTESVTVPEITTTGGEVTLDVNTTVKPSELDLTYHGWHEHQPLKRENGQWE